MKMIVIALVLFSITVSGLLSAYAQIEPNVNVRLETVASNLEIPWSIAFAPDGRIFFTERIGNLRVIEDGTLKARPIYTVDVGGGEGGLLGIALDPNFEENHYLYLYYTSPEFVFAFNKVVRFTEKDNKLFDQMVLLDGIPASFIHDGGRLKFGPDGKLYITTGDAANSAAAQDLNSLSGKILRINPDGTIPDDNPFPASPVYSYGHRNPQGLDWDPETGKLVISEHGSSGHDEVNVVEPGSNYGWPEVIGDESDSQYISPIIHTGELTWAPSGATFYTGDKISDLKDKFLIATLRGKHLRVLQLDIEDNKVLSNQVMFQDTFGRLRDIAQGPDGYLYLLTSNRDGRGSPVPNDDRIFRIISSFVVSKFVIEAEGTEFPVNVRSESEILSVDFDQELKEIVFGVEKTTEGSVSLTLSKELLGGPYSVSINSAETAFTLSENNTHATIYVELPRGSTKVLVIGTTAIPEFPTTLFVMVAAASLIIIFSSTKFTVNRWNIRKLDEKFTRL
ncbi:MAG: PQQ-dependent sugar dehydrogenase [Nitrosopumilaceae archaeon]